MTSYQRQNMMIQPVPNIDTYMQAAQQVQTLQAQPNTGRNSNLQRRIFEESKNPNDTYYRGNNDHI
jgi:hypothetical protein